MSNDLDQQIAARRMATLLDSLDRRLVALERSSQSSHTSIEGGAVKVFDSDGTLRGSIGVQPDGTVGMVPVNSAPPPTTAAPVLEPVLAGLIVTWDGTWANANAAPLDFARVQVHVGGTADFIPDATTIASSISNPAGANVTLALDGYSAVWVRLVAVNTAQVTGMPSAAVTGVPKQVANPDLSALLDLAAALKDESVPGSKLIKETIGADRIAANGITAGKIDAGAVTAREIQAAAIQTDHISAGAIDTTKLKAGAITANKLSADAIDGKTINGVVINGATLRTASTGSRVEITSVPGTDQQLASGRVRLFSGSPQEKSPAAAYATYDAAANTSRLTLMSAELTDPVSPAGTVHAFSGGASWPMASAELWSDANTAHIDLNAEYVYASGALDVRYVLDVGSSLEIHSTCPPVTPVGGNWNFIPSNQSFPHLRMGSNGIVAAHDGQWEKLLLNANLTVTENGWIARTGHEAWATIAFGTGWGNWGSGYDLVATKLYPDQTVGLRGLCKRTAKTTPVTGEILFTLPEGFRPLTYIQQFAVIVPNNGSSLTLNISSTGTVALGSLTAGAVTALTAGNGYLDLGVIRFPID
ncbi:hypothetical protein G3I60_05380 [Streptomyces sp. SID13666]|uniref:hypothetical protein n=1 Tax=Streptomyces sp. SID13666 TaxID=2706054 RepID=UPI0013C0CB15|nr:hypothetical protein [Streptomyces sp. SID13666]NEA53603.1 hypothetical protein [Streptomyces sp. SID13666]